MEPLEKRRKIHDLKFTIKSYSGLTDAQTYFHYFHPSEPQRLTRNILPFKIDTAKTNSGKFAPFNRLMTTVNEFMPTANFEQEIGTLFKDVHAAVNSMYKPKFHL